MQYIENSISISIQILSRQLSDAVSYPPTISNPALQRSRQRKLRKMCTVTRNVRNSELVEQWDSHEFHEFHELRSHPYFLDMVSTIPQHPPNYIKSCVELSYSFLGWSFSSKCLGQKMISQPCLPFFQDKTRRKRFSIRCCLCNRPNPGPLGQCKSDHIWTYHSFPSDPSPLPRLMIHLGSLTAQREVS